MQPTARAAEIAPHVRQALLQLQLALAPPEFVPARTDRRFTVACTEYAGAVLMPPFIARFRPRRRSPSSAYGRPIWGWPKPCASAASTSRSAASGASPNGSHMKSCTAKTACGC